MGNLKKEFRHNDNIFMVKLGRYYTLTEAWSGVNWADLMAAQGAFGTEFYGRSTRTIVGKMLWTEYRPVIKIGPKGALGSHKIRPIHSAPSLGQSIALGGMRKTAIFFFVNTPTYKKSRYLQKHRAIK